MSEVKLSIGSREYTVACAEGEEAHVSTLGAEINQKLQQLGGNLSSNEAQNLLFGALFLADELHETRKTVEVAQTALKQQQEEFETNKRETNLAIGQSDQLKLKISSLEQELGGLQSAQQRQSAEVDEMRRELKLRRGEAEVSRAEQEELSSQRADLTRERDVLLTQIEAKDRLLESANALISETNAKLDEARQAATPLPQFTGTILAKNQDLAPALERFADLLENCAEKLESPSTNP